MTEPENYPREMGSEIPEGAEMRDDGSYVQPGQTADVQSDTHDDAGNLLTTEEDPVLVSSDRTAAESDEEAEAMLSEQAEAQMPREQGTDVQGGGQ